MPIKQTTTAEQIDAYIAQSVNAVQNAILDRMSYIGEQVLNAARSTNSYKDQTGNLRSSIGYVIVKDGSVVRASSFEQVKNGSDGTSKGRSYAESLAARYKNGIALIVVAGMNYAAYVKKRGYDVIDSSELLAEQLVPQMLRELGLKA